MKGLPDEVRQIAGKRCYFWNLEGWLVARATTVSPSSRLKSSRRYAISIHSKGVVSGVVYCSVLLWA